MSFLADVVTSAAADPTLLDQAVLEALTLRETVFAIGDDALVELADTLLLAIGQVAAGLRESVATHARLPMAA